MWLVRFCKTKVKWPIFIKLGSVGFAVDQSTSKTKRNKKKLHEKQVDIWNIQSDFSAVLRDRFHAVFQEPFLKIHP